MKTNVCKICRRAGEKLFLKGEKCSSQKCPFLRKPFPPGQTPKKRKTGPFSEYGRELKETQKLKKIYAIGEKPFKKLIKEVLKKRAKQDVSTLLIRKLEKRLANVIFRAGFSKSQRGAQQLVSHSHFLLNDKKVNIPSIEVKIGDKIKLREKQKKSPYFSKILTSIKEQNIPSWLSFDKKKTLIKVVSDPNIKEAGIKIDIPLIISFYSR